MHSFGQLMRAACWSLVMLSTAASAQSDTCELNGRTAEYQLQNCLNATCADVHQKITFLGDKELFFYNAYDRLGITFYDGKTVDMRTDALQEQFRGTAPPGTSETATATSVRKGLQFLLTQHRQLKDGSGEVISNYWQEVGIRITSCNSCEVTLYRIRGNYREHEVFSTFQSASCHISG